MTNEKLTMSNEEAKEIIIQERDSLKANPAVKVEDCLYEAFDVAIKALEQTELNPSYNGVKSELKPRTNLAETSQDTISREALRQKLQDHHDFFVNAYGNFKGMSLSDKARVDEIDNCIAMLVNAPSVTPQPKVGKWIKTYEPNDAELCILWMCSECQNTERGRRRSKYCPNCGSYNGGGEE